MSAPPRYMLDTNIASYMLRGGNPALSRRLAAVPMASVCISAVTQGELLYGVARRPESRGLAQAVRELLSRLEVLPWDGAAATRYGVLRAQLENAGKPLGSLDALIAAHAIAADARLVTNDRAFLRVPGLVVEDWTR
ncbi:MAG: type II toxin-antitoxin system VapC family toxin [Steroidobacteraceae bacterium]|nr:type II toxin-antitoxin system VapC family toxin [Steroidobacteraceae bacterium]